MRRSTLAGCLATVALAATPASRPARSTRRRRRTRGSATSSTEARPARTRRSTSGRSPPAPLDQSRPASEGGQGQATLDPVEGSFLVGASPFGAYWYPVKAFGDAVFRIQYTVQNTEIATRNGGVMIRTPEVRYTGRQHGRRPGPEADRLQLRPLRGRAAGLRPRHARRTRRPTSGPARAGPFPPASNASDPPFDVHGRLLRAQRHDEPHQPGRNRPADAQHATPTTISTGRRSPAATRCRSTRP